MKFLFWYDKASSSVNVCTYVNGKIHTYVHTFNFYSKEIYKQFLHFMKMSFIRKQTSRLNSLDEGNCNCLSDTNSKCPVHLKLEAQNKQFLKSKKQEAEETECHTFTIELEMVVSR